MLKLNNSDEKKIRNKMFGTTDDKFQNQLIQLYMEASHQLEFIIKYF